MVDTNCAMTLGQADDISTLKDWLGAHVPGLGVVTRIDKFSGGQSNPTYLVTGTRRVVLRCKPPGTLLPSAHMVEREFAVMQALEGSGVPVPKVVLLARDDDSPLGRAFFVMEHLDGRIFWDPALPELAHETRAVVYDGMNAVLAALHSVDPVAVGLADFGKPGSYFARQTDRWTRQYLATADTPLADMIYLARWLADHMPGDDGQTAIVHGDFRLDNMIFESGGSRILGLLDWELSTLGHPLADLAYQCMQWRLPYDGGPQGMRGLGGLDRAALGLPDEADYVAAYCARRGIAVIGDWTFFLAFSFYRLAAILEGVVARARGGNASNPAAAMKYAGSIPVLAEMAARLTREGTET
ncbi:phosphotransferase family protein [Oceaniovalibus sp. ACAM 378]|uniref:phosphotransferase family protein n=1 Tax=Oceaniovalibus sp. ACAM 378 TaxID=2599923 RepID=UPI001CA3139B|nr:phosphotransferase family protein [Oceaniovalibus sp. ACAM 378]